MRESDPGAAHGQKDAIILCDFTSYFDNLLNNYWNFPGNIERVYFYVVSIGHIVRNDS